MFGEENLPSLNASVVSTLNESQFTPVSARSYAKSTDDDTSPIPSDFEVIDADDVPDELTAMEMQSGKLSADYGNYTDSGTLRRSLRIRARNARTTPSPKQ